MDETMSDYPYVNTWDVTTTTGSTNTYNLTTDGTSSVWFPYYQESIWLPYEEEKYTPKWHIAQGYKNQIKSMWD